jgi:pimeloyl-ACP methyl ester carboxylesterase
MNCYRRVAVCFATITALSALATAQSVRAADAKPVPLPRIVVQVGNSKGFVIKPTKPAADGTKPWLWYAPTIGGHPNLTNEWVFRPLVERGFMICGVDVGESYGSPAGRKIFTDFYEKLRKDYGLDRKVSFLAQSRGGLMVYNWAAENPEKVRSIVGIYPVCDLRCYPGLDKAAPAYGMSEKELEAKLTEHNPIDRITSLARHSVPILHLHGDSDTVVPLDKNSQVVHDRYKVLDEGMELIVIKGKGHAEIPEFFESKRVVEFLETGK